MASVKVSAHSLEQQKKEYEKAVKNLDNALEQIKKVNASLGKDAMLDGVRQALTKLAASLETRAGVILLMTKALEQSNAKYTAAQKKAVTKSNQFRAHNRDFYGFNGNLCPRRSPSGTMRARGSGSVPSRP